MVILTEEVRGTVSMEELSSVLWHERELLDLLVYKLETEQLILASGRTRHLGRAAREVETVLDEIRAAELSRAVGLAAVVAQLGLPDDPSLRQLVELVPEPWSSILADHHESFTTAMAEITTLAESNRDLLSAGHRAIRETLAAMQDVDGPTYGSDGSTETSRRSRNIDRSI
ncbi:flagellar protein FlgN [Solicola sp. PLA-1-18]|uniref:flagellar protein FlgN n=1 Tax=Solicola sp. PLA-1-18 TaxID=3380532 RepID=UPI003B7C71BE